MPNVLYLNIRSLFKQKYYTWRNDIIVIFCRFWPTIQYSRWFDNLQLGPPAFQNWTKYFPINKMISIITLWLKPQNKFINIICQILFWIIHRFWSEFFIWVAIITYIPHQNPFDLNVLLQWRCNQLKWYYCSH